MAITPKQAAGLNNGDIQMIDGIEKYIDEKLQNTYDGGDKSITFKISPEDLSRNAIMQKYFRETERQKPFDRLAQNYTKSGWKVSNMQIPHENEGTLELTLRAKDRRESE
jgi:hypothetical protein